MRKFLQRLKPLVSFSHEIMKPPPATIESCKKACDTYPDGHNQIEKINEQIRELEQAKK